MSVKQRRDRPGAGSRTAAILEQEVSRGSALGATAYVLDRGETVLDFACGQRDTQRPLSSTDDVPWYSTSKIASSLAIAAGSEQGLFELDAPVGDYLPEFHGGGKDAITIRHVWTHTAPLLGVDHTINTAMTWNEALTRICAANADPDWPPGSRSGYLGHAGMLLLAEIIQRRSHLPFAQFFAHHIAEPLGLRSRLGAPPCAPDLIDVPFLGTAPTNVRFNATAGFPSNCITGPISDGAILCHLLLHGGTLAGQTILQPETVTALTAPQHYGFYDERLHMPAHSGLGLAIDEYDFGRYCSPRTFGHGGARSSVAFGDPDTGIAVAIFFNGQCPFREHVARINAAASAIYLDLGLATPTDGGRNHPGPFGLLI